MAGIKFSVDELAAVRLLQLHAYGMDLAAHDDTSVDRDDRETWQQARSLKEAALQELIRATNTWATALEIPANLAALSGLEVGSALVDTVARLLADLEPVLSRGSETGVLLEAVVSTEWPKGAHWTLSKEATLAQGAVLLGFSASEERIDGLARGHKRAFKRLRRDSIAPGAQVGVGAFIAVGFALTGGASEAVGTAIGTHVLGYSGAAATSAGLALLGGGSLAAGGFGMAGGALLVGVMAHGAASASRNLLASTLARQSSAAFIHELAKLHVMCDDRPELQAEMLKSLRALHAELHSEWTRLRPDPAVRRRKIWDHVATQALSEPGEMLRMVRSELPDGEERSLASSVRALEYELRYLEAPDWERQASVVPRTLGVPAVGRRVFDFFKE